MPFTGIPLSCLIFGLICYSRRKEEIGGWLLFYYIQLYIGIAVSLLLLPLSFGSFLPSGWVGEPGQYALYLLSTLPVFAVVIAQVIVAHRLRRSRDAAYLIPLRRILWADLVFSIVKLAIDAKFSWLNIVLDPIAVLWPAFWLPYFYRSIRVGHVFVTKDWQRVAEFVVD
jgi:hypothetical protein